MIQMNFSDNELNIIETALGKYMSAVYDSVNSNAGAFQNVYINTAGLKAKIAAYRDLKSQEDMRNLKVEKVSVPKFNDSLVDDGTTYISAPSSDISNFAESKDTLTMNGNPNIGILPVTPFSMPIQDSQESTNQIHETITYKK